MTTPIPQTDEEALALLFHPFTTEYQNYYLHLRDNMLLSVQDALLAALEHRSIELQRVIDQLQIATKKEE